MWICPKCQALNYEKGECECCGYSKEQVLDKQYEIKKCYTPLRKDGIDQLCDIQYPIITC
jgi:hypothetical protein